MKPVYIAANVQSWLKSGSARANCQSATFCMAWLTFFRVNAGDRSLANGGGAEGVSPTMGFSAGVSCPHKLRGMKRMAAARLTRRMTRIIDKTLLWRILYCQPICRATQSPADAASVRATHLSSRDNTLE